MKFFAGSRIKTRTGQRGVVLTGQETMWEGTAYLQVKLDCEAQPRLIVKSTVALEGPMEVTVTIPGEAPYTYVVHSRSLTRERALMRALELERVEV